MIALDLRTDLAKITPDIIARAGDPRCRYTAPCAVGAMMSVDERYAIRDAGHDITMVANLITGGGHNVPKMIDVVPDQFDDIVALQYAFDDEPAQFATLVNNLQKKYQTS